MVYWTVRIILGRVYIAPEMRDRPHHASARDHFFAGVRPPPSTQLRGGILHMFSVFSMRIIKYAHYRALKLLS